MVGVGWDEMKEGGVGCDVMLDTIFSWTWTWTCSSDKQSATYNYFSRIYSLTHLDLHTSTSRYPYPYSLLSDLLL